jgi:hypothetical protein
MGDLGHGVDRVPPCGSHVEWAEPGSDLTDGYCARLGLFFAGACVEVVRDCRVAPGEILVYLFL